MATVTPLPIDLARVDALIELEEADFTKRHSRSVALTARARRSLAGGVASSWQDAPPHPIYIRSGAGSRIVDADGQEYVDMHNGYGVMVVGHAHPAVVQAVQARIALGSHFAQPTEQDLLPVSEALQERFGLPLWRFGNSGTEATLDAVRLMRAATGRDLLLKVEGTYHGHHDAVMVSVLPDPGLMGPRDHPASVPQTLGLPRAVTELTRVVPFNDLPALERLLDELRGRVAGLIMEPIMMNIGVVAPVPGYLEGVRELTRAHDVLLAFDEVKTGATVAYGGATGLFGVQPDLICLAKAIGGGLPCGALGGTAAVMGLIADGTIDQVGTFNGNPLTMAAARATLTEVLTPPAYEHLGQLHGELARGCQAVIDQYRLPAHIAGFAAKGSVTFADRPVRDYRDHLGIEERVTYASWLFQHNRGVFMSPWSKQEQWTLSVQHSPADVRRYVENFAAFAAALRT